MQFIKLVLMLQIFLLTNGLFFKKPIKKKNQLIAAKYDPEMPKRVRELLDQIGDNLVVKIQLGRTPVEAVLILFLNLVSAWKFSSKQLELGYDEIYHNYLLITIQNQGGPKTINKMIEAADDSSGSAVYKLDKAHRVRLVQPVFPTEFVDIYDIPLTTDKMFTLNRLITTSSNIDKHFYTYDAANNNMCQTFVENILDINGLSQNILDNDTRIALKPQDAKALVATLGSRSDIVKRITDLGGKLDKLVFDHKIRWKTPVIKEFATFGNMHVRKAGDPSEDLLLSSADTVVVHGMTDTIVENFDEVFDAAVALEDEDKLAKKNRMILTILAIGLGILLVTGAIVAFYIWRKRKGSIKDMVNDPKSDSSLSKTADVIEN